MRPRHRPLLVALLLLAGCGDDDGEGSAPTTGAPTTSTSAPATTPPGDGTTSTPSPPSSVPVTVPLSDLRLSLTEVAVLDAPIGFIARPGTGELWLAEQGGRVVALRGGEPETTVDISDDTEASGEQGLLGIAFDAAGERLFLSYTDNDGDSHVDVFAVSADGVVDTGSRTEVFFVDQPFSNHNGGHLLLGPDDAIWYGLGDGGAGGDPDGHAQTDGDPLGKLLRLAPGDDEFEIVARGLRNPWRFSFDRETDDLWLGDVGQDSFEEIDRVPFDLVVGADFAWDRREGNHDFDGSARPDDVVPVFEYGRENRCSVTGGFVYRGSAIPGLVGTYLYGDYCEGVVRGLRVADDGAVVEGPLGLEPGPISSFGEDAAGELHVLSLDGGVYRIDPA